MLRIGATFPEHYVGLSDHSGTIYPSIFALSHQASMIEVHVTFDKRMFGPDSPSSLDFDQLHSVVEARNMLSLMKNTHTIFNKQHFSRSLVAKRHIPKDQQVSSDLLTAKKPFIPGAIPAGDLFTVVGRTATQDIPEQTVLLPEFFQ
jgi:N-acetylneuraminate synthase